MKRLFIVGTPIGNFDDITLRALETLKSVDYIACEDTRNTKKLLDHFEIKNKKLIAHHNFNEQNSAKGIIDLILKQNITVALVSDAGMPTIADPGFNLIEQAKKNNIEFEIIPGVSALTTIISASNMGPNFTFLGFGKQKKEHLAKQIESLIEGTYIFFIAPHKLEYFLDLIKSKIKAEYTLFLGREMTKKFETFYEGNVDEIKDQLDNKYIGEFTLVIKIFPPKKIKINKYKK